MPPGPPSLDTSPGLRSEPPDAMTHVQVEGTDRLRQDYPGAFTWAAHALEPCPSIKRTSRQTLGPVNMFTFSA